MANSTINPTLADLRQDIAGPIPVDLIRAWVESPQTPHAQEQLLEPYKRTGTIVCSDASGLSKLSAGKPLIEVMKLVSQPKEVIYAHGTAIGGRGVGVWAADNTQMFYDAAIDVNHVVSQMIAAQKAMHDVQVDVGIGILTGVCYEIGGGLYGEHADEIEEFTEEHSGADEVIISASVRKSLQKAFLARLTPKRNMFVLDYRNLEVSGAASKDIFYPAPFDRAFHESLLAIDLNDRDALAHLHAERVRNKTIVLLRIFHKDEPLMLNEFTRRVLANTRIHGVSGDHACQVVKSNGTLAIMACDSEAAGVDLAIALHAAMNEGGYAANIGVAAGEVLIFDLGDQSDIAGGPVNVASKLAEDTSERGVVFLEASVADHARQHGGEQKFTIEKSGVTLEGIMMT